MPRTIITKLVRHSSQAPKTRRTNTGLTRKGIIEARELGRKIPLGWKVKEYYTPAIRTESSSRFALGAFRAKGGKTYPTKRRVKRGPEKGAIVKKAGVKNELWYIKDIPELQKLTGEYGENDRVVLRQWLDGKLDPKIIGNPKKLADAIIRKRFGLGKRLVERGLGGLGRVPVKEAGDKIILRNVTHQWLVEAVLERLTGMKYTEFGRGTAIRENESLSVIHYLEKTLLKYRGKTIDVTKRFNEILAG
ncbi:MAG: hypothetical protein HYW05_04730 [Candidatus Diapherotrites archaeon]|nr:hypothetical protein [Candidatus Diapherotrites archaeon]